MKKSTKLIIGITIALSFAIGFFVGVVLNIPPQKESDLAGTIGKINNYRNVKISDNDIKLRNDLMKDEKLIKKYKDYYNFQYLYCAKLGTDLDYVIDASTKESSFSSNYSKEISAITNYRNFIKEARKEILIALSVVNNLYESDQISISSIINNANNAIAQIKYRESIIGDFVILIESYLSNNKTNDLTQLKKAHDLLLLSQLNNAVATNNKPLIKYIDKKEFFTSVNELKSLSNFNTPNLQLCLIPDASDLGLNDIDSKLFDKMEFDQVSSLKSISEWINSNNTIDINSSQMTFDNSSANFNAAPSELFSTYSNNYDTYKTE